MPRLHLDPLPPEELRTVQELEAHHGTARIRRRARVVLMSGRAFSQSAIAKALCVSAPFVCRALRRYRRYGFLGLFEQHKGAAPKLSPEQICQVLHWLEQGPSASHYQFAQWDTRTLQWRIAQVFNVKLTREAIRKMLHRHGYRWKRPKKSYARVDEKAHQRTKADLEDLIERARQGKIILLLEDEAIATLISTLQAGWSLKGQQPVIPSSGRRGPAYRCVVFAVVNPITGKVHYRLLPALNRDNMKRFVRQLARFYKNAPQPVYMVLDNHGAHKKLDEAFAQAGIRPYYLSPYCGDLNGIERLWAWMRGRNLHNVFFESLAALKAAIREFFCYIAGVKERVIARVA
jgi:transposase